MRNFLFIGILICGFVLIAINVGAQANKNSYDKEWKNVEELIIKKDLPKSALEAVKKIYDRAKKEGNQAQIIKALFYMSDLQSRTREDNLVKAIAELEKELGTLKEPATSILQSLIADLYLQYFYMNRYKFYDRTETVNFVKTDIETWTADDLHRRISELYLASIQNDELLKKTNLSSFEPIIVKGNVRHLRPTLYDLLANRALGYFENDERDISKPAYAFQIDQPEAFATADQFIRHKFITRDSLSLQHKAVLIYQELLAFHISDANPAALVDADIHRIRFVYQNSVSPEKDSLYIDALQKIANKYPNQKESVQALYLIAEKYDQQANGYRPYMDSTHRLKRVRAKEIAQQILRGDSTSEGWVNAYNLLKGINRKELTFEIEKTNVPDKPFRMLVNYRNTEKLFFRIIKWNTDLYEKFNTNSEDFWNAVFNTPVIKSWENNMPGVQDHNSHKAEVKVDPLSSGEYFMIVSSTQDPKKSEVVGGRGFSVSNISFVNNQNDHFVLHRETGKPLVAANVQVWETVYDYERSINRRVKGASYKTDANGFFKLERKKEIAYRSYWLEIEHNGENFFSNDALYNYYYYDPTRDTARKDIPQTFLFTDRSIYRPGQQVYFKGLVVNRSADGKKNNVLSALETITYLRNANGQIVDSMKLITNDFGSFAGKFTLKEGGLNGQFSIYTKVAPGSAYFSVEDYKRPKFEVSFEKLKGTYKLNDSIHVTGTAKAYAGNNISNATVKYRVIRQQRFHYPWLRIWPTPSEDMEIAFGEIKTDKDGKFIIPFKAIPDLKFKKEHDPFFNYQIHVDVTDINGETRSGNTNVAVSYKSLLVRLEIPKTQSADSLRAFEIFTENLAGEFEPAMLSVTVNKLIPEQRLIRKRFWDRPDQFLIDKAAYVSLFPHDEFNNETDPRTWRIGDLVYQTSDSSRSNGELPVRNANLHAGYYQIIVETKDKDGNPIKIIDQFELFDLDDNKLAIPSYLWTSPSKPIEPGESTTVKVGSSANDVHVIHFVDRDDRQDHGMGTISNTIISNERKPFTFTATEADRGGYQATFIFVKDNRFYSYSDLILVPWTNKELKIEVGTFREKVFPGSNEKWTVKITGVRKEQFAGEVLASMYDASLDQFRHHRWIKPSLWKIFVPASSWNGTHNFYSAVSIQQHKGGYYDGYRSYAKDYDDLISDVPWPGVGGRRLPKSAQRERVAANGYVKIRGVSKEENAMAAPEAVTVQSARKVDVNADGADLSMDESVEDREVENVTPTSDQPIQVRRNFNETAFFFPQLRTDSNGAIELTFTVPEALTKWKFQALSHTKDLSLGLLTKEIITQKQLMVQPNMPRFLREGDRIGFSAKIVNLTEKEMTGQAELQLFDATTNQPVDGWFQNIFPNQYFTVAAKSSEVVNFPIEAPYLFNKALTWRIIARAGEFSDGEENAIPVLTNRMLVTETMPLPVRGNETKNFVFEKLTKSGESETLKHHALTVEFTSNPAWYAVQALPYLMEYPYDCAEQLWNRYYANALASMIANSSPRIKQVFEKWKNTDTSALLSNLQKNQELKSVLLEETPWVLQAQTEAQQKKNIALLFDMMKMESELTSSLEKLKQLQSPNGGFVWFKGGPDDRFVTQYITTGIGHLIKLNALSADQKAKLTEVQDKAFAYLGRKIKEDYDNLVKRKADLKKQQIGYMQVQFLYMTSFFPEKKIPQEAVKAYKYYRGQAAQFWTSQNKYMQGMISLALHRTNDTKTPKAILKSLKERSIVNEEMGMYWIDNAFGKSWFWYQAPIETQSLMIEAFSEIGNDTRTVDDLRTWLLKHKQTNSWRTTKATAEACYALLLQGTNWLSSEPVVSIRLGNKVISNNDTQNEAGTGYFKEKLDGQLVTPDMGNVTVTVDHTGTNQGTASATWGSVYWQYFEDLDKITNAATPLNISKKLFVEKNTDRGPVLTPVADGNILKVGDKIKVRVELRVDRDMEYVHMKDMRASSLEPVNVLSGYKWQGGLGYYESTRDASTNFFFNYLRKGTYVFEYTLFATHAGNFSNGITSIQCMYAPEFSAHSEGVRIEVEE